MKQISVIIISLAQCFPKFLHWEAPKIIVHVLRNTCLQKQKQNNEAVVTAWKLLQYCQLPYKNSCNISRYNQISYTFIPPFLVEPSLGNNALVESENISLNRYLTKRITSVIFPAASYRQIHRDQHMDQ